MATSVSCREHTHASATMKTMKTKTTTTTTTGAEDDLAKMATSGEGSRDDADVGGGKV